MHAESKDCLFFTLYLLLFRVSGCCFVTYFTRKAALRAQDALHNIKTLDGVSLFYFTKVSCYVFRLSLGWWFLTDRNVSPYRDGAF